MAEKMQTGEGKAWEILAEQDPREVCRKAGVSLDGASGRYLLRSLGEDFSVDPQARQIAALTPGGEVFLTRLGHFFRLSALWYLCKATDAVPSGRLVKPEGFSGGEIFFRGTHVLPLDAVASRFGNDAEGFTTRGRGLGGRIVPYGDTAVELSPFPKIPATLILWLGDEEWPARADLLFDATAVMHVPLDIVWSIAMLVVLVFPR